MKIIVRPHETELIKEEVVNKGEYNVQQILFDFSEEYKTLNKRIIFTIVKTNESFEGLLVEDKCNIPFEVTQDIGSIYIGVCGYKTKENSTELDIRYSPKGCFFAVEDGSYRPAKESEIPSADLIEQYEERLNKSLNAINKKIKEVENQGNYAQEQGNYAKEQGNNIIESNKEAEKIIKDFEGNVNSSTILFNKNVLEKTNEFDNHVNEATETFDNHVTEKTNEFDENVNSIKEKLDDLYNNQIVGVAEGNSIYLEDSAEAKIKSIEIEGNLSQYSTTGKNIYNKNTAYTIGVENQNIGNIVNLEASTEYFFNTDNRIWATVKLFDVNNNLTRTLGNTRTTTFVNFTTTEDEIKAECLFYSGANTDIENFNFTNIQFEKGNSFTEYEEYTGGLSSPSISYPQIVNTIDRNLIIKINNEEKENICVINLKNNILAKTNYAIDKLKIINNHAYIEKNIEKEKLVSTSKWNKLPETDTYYEYATQSAKVSKKCQNPIKLSTHFGKENNNKLVVAGNDQQTIYVRIPKNIGLDVSTLELWKAFLDENEVYFYYELVDAEIIDLGIIEMPKTHKNITNISLIANLDTNMTVEYIKDTETVINNLQKQINNINTLLSTTETSAFLLENYQNELMEEI